MNSALITPHSSLALSFSPKDMREALSDLGSIARKNSLPILNTLRASIWRHPSGESFLALVANDLDLELTRYIPLHDEVDPFLCLLDPVKMRALLKGKRGNSITLDFALARSPLKPEDFPTSPSHGEKVPTYGKTLEPSVLESIHRCLPFASDDPTRYILEGVYLNFKEREIAATDGRRLHIEEAPDTIEDHPPASSGIILPSAAVRVLPKDFKESFRLRFSERRVAVFDFGNWGQLTTRLVDGNYPNYNQVIPSAQKFSTIWCQVTDGLRQAVADGCSLVKALGIHTLALVLDKEGNATLHWLPKLNSNNEVTDAVKIDDVPGVVVWHDYGDKPTSELEIAVNPTYFRQALETGIESLLVTDEMSPLYFNHQTRRHILMPVRLSKK
jgi:hypothetical protein